MHYLAMPNVNDDGEFGPLGEGSTKQPIVVTFGSPFVGNREFKRAFDDVSLNASSSNARLPTCQLLIRHAFLL